MGRRREVWLKVYDLSEGKAAAVSPLLLKKPIRGIWHTSIEAWNTEYYYGGFIERVSPKTIEREYGMKPDVVELLGYTRVCPIAFEEFLSEIEHDFTPKTYDLVDWNCNHFADVCSRFLLKGRGISKEYLCQPNEVSKSLVGKAILRLMQLAQENPARRDEKCRHKNPVSGGTAPFMGCKPSFRPVALQQKIRNRHSKHQKETWTHVAGALMQAGLMQKPLDIVWEQLWPFSLCLESHTDDQLTTSTSQRPSSEELPMESQIVVLGAPDFTKVFTGELTPQQNQHQHHQPINTHQFTTPAKLSSWNYHQRVTSTAVRPKEHISGPDRIVNRFSSSPLVQFANQNVK